MLHGNFGTQSIPLMTQFIFDIWHVLLHGMDFETSLLDNPFMASLLRVKPKLPGAKTRSHRFLDVMGGMNSGFSLCAAPAFCRGPGILKIGRYMRILRVAGKLQG